MKKLLLLIGCLLSLPSMAELGNHPCRHLYITINNQTSNTCYLISDAIYEGRLFDQNKLPLKIPPQHSAQLDMFQDLRQRNCISLKYECGENTILLYSEQSACSTDNKTTAKVVVSTGISANYKTLAANYWQNQAATIEWTLIL